MRKPLSYLGEANTRNIDHDVERARPGVAVCDARHLRHTLAGDVTCHTIDGDGVASLPENGAARRQVTAR